MSVYYHKQSLPVDMQIDGFVLEKLSLLGLMAKIKW